MKVDAADIAKFTALAGLGVCCTVGVLPASVLAGGALLQSFAGSAAYDLTGSAARAFQRRFLKKLGEPNHDLNKALNRAITDALSEINLEKEFRETFLKGDPTRYDKDGGHAALEDFFRALKKGKSALVLPEARNADLIAFMESGSEEDFAALSASYPATAFPGLPAEAIAFTFRRLHDEVCKRFWDQVKNDSPAWRAYANEIFDGMRESLGKLEKGQEKILSLLTQRETELLDLPHPPAEIIVHMDDTLREMEGRLTSKLDANQAATMQQFSEVKGKLDELSPSSHITPHQLPPAAGKYFGRDKEKAALGKLLREGKDTYVLSSAGMGKTALAAEVLQNLLGTHANALAQQFFPHGIVFLDLYLLKADADAVWAALADALAGSGFERNSSARDRAAQACANRHCLIIIEGAEEADGKEGAATLAALLAVRCTQTRTLILTRERNQTLKPSTVEIRESLSAEDAAALLEFHAGGAVPADVRDGLLALLEGHPLAITWAGGLIGQGTEEARDLFTDWTSESLPKINDPEKPHHTLHWLFARNTRKLSPDCLRFLHAAGWLARAPFPIAAFDDAPGIGDPAACAKALVSAGILRLASEEGHREFTHVLGHRFATVGTESAGEELARHLALWLARELYRSLFSPGTDECMPRIIRLLQHSSALLGAHAGSTVLWDPLANLMLYDFSERLRALGRLGLAKDAISSSADWLKALPDANIQEPKWQRELAVSHEKLGDIAVAQGDLAAARASYTAGLKIRKTLAARDAENTEWQRDLSVSHIKLGDLAVAQGDLPAARASYAAALEIAKTLAARDGENTQWQRDLSISHDNLGDIAVAEGDLAAARASYTAALEIRKTLAARDAENTQWQRDLSISHNNLGDIAVAEGDLAAARAAYSAGLGIRETLVAWDAENTQWQRALSVSHNRLGDIAVAQGDLAAARASYAAGLEIRETLAARDAENTEWQRDLFVSHIKLGDLAVAQGDLAAAHASYSAGLEIAETLATRDAENTEWQRDLSIIHNKLGDIAVAEGDLAAARASYAAALEIAETLTARDEGNTQWQRDLSISHEKLGDIAVAQGDLAAARASYSASLEIRETLAARDEGNTQWQRDLWVSHNKLGDLAVAKGELAAAQAAYTAGLGIAETLVIRDSNNTQWQRDLSVSHNNLGDLAVAEGDLAAARAAYSAGLEIAKTLAARDPENTQWQRDVAVSYSKLATLAEKDGDEAEARKQWLACIAVFEEMIAAGKHVSPGDRQNLANIKQHLGIE